MTTHVREPSVAEVVTARRWGDPAASMARGLAEYLEGLSGVEEAGRPVTFVAVLHEHSERAVVRPPGVTDADPWPPYPRVVVVQDGPCSYSTDVGPGPIVATTSPGVRVRQIGQARVQLMVHLSALGAPMRRTALAMLDAALAPVDWSTGVRLALDHYHGVHASYAVTSVEIADTSDSATRGERDATVLVDATCPRVQLLGLPDGVVRLDAEDVSPDTTLTAADGA